MSDETNKLVEESPVETDSAALVEQGEAVPASDPPAGPPAAEITEESVEEAVEVVEDAVEEVIAAEASEQTDSETGAGEDVTDENAPDEDATEDEADEDVAESEAEGEVAAEEESEVEPIEEIVEESESDEIKMDWYILKVQSNREKSISAALERKIAVEGLQDYFGEVVVPVEKVTEFKGGKKKVVNRKLYPGYIVVRMCINDDTWFAVRETSGIGDFTGSGGKPTPMLPHEVARIIQTEEEETEDAPKLNISFKIGDQVKVNDGNFESFEGEVNAIDEHSGRITVMINIFGRSTPVELEYWQVEQT